MFYLVTKKSILFVNFLKIREILVLKERRYNAAIRIHDKIEIVKITMRVICHVI
jgi:hypothetical protein